jgi:hypothetical protein
MIAEHTRADQCRQDGGTAPEPHIDTAAVGLDVGPRGSTIPVLTVRLAEHQGRAGHADTGGSGHDDGY